ncbi:MAG: hypothetical protein V1709_09880, partial [Planctomycetota bacterium]
MEDLSSTARKLLEKDSNTSTPGCNPDDQRKFLSAFIEEFDNIDDVDVKKAVEIARKLKGSKSLSDWKILDGERRAQFVGILNTVINKEECLKLDDFPAAELEELRDQLKS